MPHSIEIDFEKVSREIIILVRGRFSQERLSQGLGFQFNQVHKWESGRKKIAWSDFAKLCDFRRKPLATATAKTVGFTVDPGSARAILKGLAGDTDPRLAAQKLNVSAPTLRRWLRGQGEPTLADMLKYMHLSRTRLMTFCEYLNLSALPASLEAFRTVSERGLEIARNYPWMPALMASLELRDCKTLASDALLDHLARTLGLPRVEIENLLKQLVISNVLEYSPSGRVTPTTDSTQIADSVESAKILLSYWLRHAARFTATRYPSPQSLAAFCHFSVSRENAAKIRQRVHQFWSELGPLLHEEQEREEMFSLVLGMVHTDDFDLAGTSTS